MVGGGNAAPLRSIRSRRKKNTVAGRDSLSREMTVPTRGDSTPARTSVSMKSVKPTVRTASGRAMWKEGFGWTAVELGVGVAVALFLNSKAGMNGGGFVELGDSLKAGHATQRQC